MSHSILVIFVKLHETALKQPDRRKSFKFSKRGRGEIISLLTQMTQEIPSRLMTSLLETAVCIVLWPFRAD